MTWTTLVIAGAIWCLVSLVVALAWGRILRQRTQRYEADVAARRPARPSRPVEAPAASEAVDRFREDRGSSAS